jgi:hypothetical protein
MFSGGLDVPDLILQRRIVAVDDRATPLDETGVDCLPPPTPSMSSGGQPAGRVAGAVGVMIGATGEYTATRQGTSGT